MSDSSIGNWLISNHFDCVYAFNDITVFLSQIMLSLYYIPPYIISLDVNQIIIDKLISPLSSHCMYSNKHSDWLIELMHSNMKYEYSYCHSAVMIDHLIGSPVHEWSDRLRILIHQIFQILQIPDIKFSEGQNALHFHICKGLQVFLDRLFLRLRI